MQEASPAATDTLQHRDTSLRPRSPSTRGDPPSLEYPTVRGLSQGSVQEVGVSDMSDRAVIRRLSPRPPKRVERGERRGKRRTHADI